MPAAAAIRSAWTKGRDPDYCTDVRWCDRADPHGPEEHSRELATTAMHAPNGDEVPVSFRFVMKDGEKRPQMQIGSTLIDLSDDDVRWLATRTRETGVKPRRSAA